MKGEKKSKHLGVAEIGALNAALVAPPEEALVSGDSAAHHEQKQKRGGVLGGDVTRYTAL